jgi:hypothetical protein
LGEQAGKEDSTSVYFSGLHLQLSYTLASSHKQAPGAASLATWATGRRPVQVW